ncbi:MAG: hypothetical protein ABIP81_00235, partial [Terriglobales bacterium]
SRKGTLRANISSGEKDCNTAPSVCGLGVAGENYHGHLRESRTSAAAISILVFLRQMKLYYR